LTAFYADVKVAHLASPSRNFISLNPRGNVGEALSKELISIAGPGLAEG